MAVTVKLDGLKDLEAELAKLSKAAGKAALRRAGIKAMQPMAELARSLAPDDPSTPPIDLKTSIAVSSRVKVGRSRSLLREVREGKASVNVYMGPTKEGYPQAIMQEFGTIHHGPQSYMRPAWDAEKRGVLSRLKALLWDEVGKSVARAERRRAND